ncbi:VaFE repeat-containing surface-anchored protein [Clostridium sp. C45]|uniref:VaFE repeat-containing surface-anchored protein n=1 Tax=Clostridium sp. 10cd* TaxID=3373596 RepID=UPI0037C0D8F5
MSADQIADVALSIEYVKQYTDSHKGISSQHAYLLRQLVVWQRLSVHLGWGCDNVRAAYDEIPKAVQDEVFAGAKAFVKENKGRYDCYGYIYSGEGQELGQFYAKLAVGNGKIQKSSSNTGITESNDCYSIAGATYGVYADKSCKEQLATLTTDNSGSTETVELKAATYYVKETKAPKGFQLDKNMYTLTVKVGETEIVDLTDEEHSVYNQIKRGDIEGVKIAAGTHKRLANVPFRITSKTTGESHVIVTDANGQFSTSADWVSHTQNTNEGKTSEDGIWFGTSAPDDSKGALPYDTYTIEELRCDSNKGMTLIPAFDVVVSRDKTVIDLGTLTDEYEPEITIHTTAADKATGEKSIVTGKSVTIVDTVTLDGLKKGTKYQLKGWQMVKSENAQLLVDGKPVENDYTFTAKDSKMEIEMAFTFNASALGGSELVTFEELYDLSNPDEPIKVAEHKDIEDDGQTVTIKERVITVHTTATSKTTGEKMIVAGKEVTIVDTVTLDGLEKDTQYQLKGWQMIKSENAQLLIDGKPVENDLTFTATDSKMEVQIEFTFNASELAGKELVTFEELYDVTNPDEPIKIAEHKDIEDEGQTVTITERIITMHTTASDKATGEKTINANKEVTIVDTVTLDGLETGTQYQLKGWQMIKSENAQLLIDGKPVENDFTFTATDSKMEVQIEFTFNASELAGKELVTFEELFDVTNPDEPIKVAEHKDIDDEGQTVTVKEQPEPPVTPEESDTPETPSRAGNSSKTGDNTPLAALLAMLGISSAGLIFAAYKRFYKKKAD